jgi:hypothetical protein
VMTQAQKERLVSIFSALDEELGDTDPETYGMSRAEIRQECPLLWAAQEIGKLIGRGEISRYCPDHAWLVECETEENLRNEIEQLREQATELQKAGKDGGR